MAKIIRTPTRAEGGLTPEEKTKLDAHAQMWIDRAMRIDPTEPEKIVPAIEGLYAAAGLKKPRVVVVPSPLVMAFAYGASAAIWHVRKSSAKSAATDSATRSATDSATRSATYLATHSATDLATRSATDLATRSATYLATHSATDSAAHSAARACFEVAGKFGLQCAQRWGANYQGGNMWAPYDCYLTAARDILGLRLPEHVSYAFWEQAAIYGGFRVMHEEFCLVSDFPEFIKTDAERRPHCEYGPSYRWRDGWSLYHWHGVEIPAEWVEDKASLSAKMALTWANIEQRRAACEIVGWEKILQELNARTIDKDADPEIGELVEVSIPEGGKERFLRVKCGTKRQFALPVPPTMKTALQANAWTFGYDDCHDFTKPEVRT